MKSTEMWESYEKRNHVRKVAILMAEIIYKWFFHFVDFGLGTWSRILKKSVRRTEANAECVKLRPKVAPKKSTLSLINYTSNHPSYLLFNPSIFTIFNHYLTLKMRELESTKKHQYNTRNQP